MSSIYSMLCSSHNHKIIFTKQLGYTLFVIFSHSKVVDTRGVQKVILQTSDWSFVKFPSLSLVGTVIMLVFLVETQRQGPMYTMIVL